MSNGLVSFEKNPNPYPTAPYFALVTNTKL